MKRGVTSAMAIVAGVWLAAQPSACTYDVPDLVSSDGGAAGAGTGTDTGTTTATATATAAATGGGGSSGTKLCDADGAPCTNCPDTCHPVFGCSECNDDEDCPPGEPKCVEGRCLTCGNDSDCATGLVCSVLDGGNEPRTWCTQPCSGAFDCTFNTTCNVDGRCVECPEESCDNDEACNLLLGVCEACASDADCAGTDTPRCGAEHECVGCLVDADCPLEEVCRNHQCELACCGDADCTTAALPYCDTATAECAACTSADHCMPSTPYCVNHTCRECTSSTEATDCAVPTPRCYGGTCSQCSPATEATDCAAPTPNCSGGSCVQCIFNSDCADPTPHCSPIKTCVACTANAHCNGGTCVNYQCT